MREKMSRCKAVVLAAGSGKRMHSSQKKQFMRLCGRPVVCHSLQVLEESFVDEVALVVSGEDIDYCRTEIVDRYGFSKVKKIIAGGKERYHSVAAGLESLKDCDYVFIHDGARPVVTREILERALESVKVHEACVVGMPVKDTIKIADGNGFVTQTLDRGLVWMIQTPQVFSYPLIRKAYSKLLGEEAEFLNRGISITDDAMVVETVTDHCVKLVEGSYENIKITTPEDLLLAESFLRRGEGGWSP